MSMATWNPLNELDTIRHQLERMMQRVWSGARPGHGRGEAGPFASLQPPVELYTPDEDTLVVTVELPGLRIEDVQVALSEDALTVSGELRREGRIDEDAYFRSERLYGRFERTIPLPYRVKDAEAQASFRHGLLTVRMPLAETFKRQAGRKLVLESR